MLLSQLCSLVACANNFFPQSGGFPGKLSPSALFKRRESRADIAGKLEKLSNVTAPCGKDLEQKQGGYSDNPAPDRRERVDSLAAALLRYLTPSWVDLLSDGFPPDEEEMIGQSTPWELGGWKWWWRCVLGEEHLVRSSWTADEGKDDGLALLLGSGGLVKNSGAPAPGRVAPASGEPEPLKCLSEPREKTAIDLEQKFEELKLWLFLRVDAKTTDPVGAKELLVMALVWELQFSRLLLPHRLVPAYFTSLPMFFLQPQPYSRPEQALREDAKSESCGFGEVDADNPCPTPEMSLLPPEATTSSVSE
ncbi:uncharacterized protein [Struthio camelus]|uniref:uncharacterized protein n=1 Tax=Struthio camelus TaxID=8801 RepID=UPI003603F023